MILRRRLTAVLTTAGLAVGILTAAAVPAAAAAPTDTCGGSVKVVADLTIESLATGAPVGVVQVRRDSNYYYWACVTFYNALPAGHSGDAILERWLDAGAAGTFGCDSDGGTDQVAPGGRFCRTPKILAPSNRVTFTALGLMERGLTRAAVGGPTRRTR